MNDFQQSLARLPYIGAQRVDLLAKLGITTRDDLLFYLPHRHEDRANFVPLSQAQSGQVLTLRGTIVQARATRWRGGRQVFEITVTPAQKGKQGLALRCLWFNVYYLPKILVKDRELILHGKISEGKKGLSMVHPEFELVEPGDDEEDHIHLNRITPVYGLTEGLSQRMMRRLLFEQTQRMPVEIAEYYPAPADLPPLAQAVKGAHFPGTFAEQTAAMQRIIYDEFFHIQCLLAQRRFSRKKNLKTRPAAGGGLAQAFLDGLPFKPTGAQQKVMREIETDLSLPAPMNRLLQGDVGAGKTLVAVYAMLLAAERGQQAALMAPTEILAEQHYLNMKRWLEPLGVSVGLHTGSRKRTDRSPMDELPLKQALFKGVGSVIVGTHALLFDSYVADELGLVVIDEQHKFGVLQRLALTQKGKNPDILVMTATPIPRTLGMTLYGDLDVSILDELPPGRGELVTACRSQNDLPKVWAFLKKQVAEGRQAYIVYPLVDESEKIEAKAVQIEFERLQAELKPIRVGLMHGRLKPKEKETIMQRFRAGEIQVLVSTAVIEVGVDVPNATLMVIENAERFGLAQLHQLRGRVGRGGNKSYCALIGEPKSKESWRRLKIMEETSDGFLIAEEDLKIRGPGNIFGTEQSGLPPLRFGDLIRDFKLLSRARQDAEALVREDVTLAKFPELRDVLNHSTGGRRKSLASVS
jgi:ATP-dependent DNA helicase RecG